MKIFVYVWDLLWIFEIVNKKVWKKYRWIKVHHWRQLNKRDSFKKHLYQKDIVSYEFDISLIFLI